MIEICVIAKERHIVVVESQQGSDSKGSNDTNLCGDIFVVVDHQAIPYSKMHCNSVYKTV